MPAQSHFSEEETGWERSEVVVLPGCVRKVLLASKSLLAKSAGSGNATNSSHAVLLSSSSFFHGGLIVRISANQSQVRPASRWCRAWQGALCEPQGPAPAPQFSEPEGRHDAILSSKF